MLIDTQGPFKSYDELGGKQQVADGMGTMTRYQKSVLQSPDTQTWSLTEKQTIQTDRPTVRNTSCYTAA